MTIVNVQTGRRGGGDLVLDPPLSTTALQSVIFYTVTVIPVKSDTCVIRFTVLSGIDLYPLLFVSTVYSDTISSSNTCRINQVLLYLSTRCVSIMFLDLVVLGFCLKQRNCWCIVTFLYRFVHVLFFIF